MNKWSRIAVTSTVALALATPAFAQSTAPVPEAAPRTEQPAPNSSGTGMPDSQAPAVGGSDSRAGTSAEGEVIVEQRDGQTLSSEIIGMKVVGTQGETLGEVSELLIDDTRVTGAILSVGGVLGLGAKEVGVPWDAVSMSDQQGTPVAMVALTKEQLSDMPEFKTLADAKAEESRTAPTGTTGGGISTQ